MKTSIRRQICQQHNSMENGLFYSVIIEMCTPNESPWLEYLLGIKFTTDLIYKINHWRYLKNGLCSESNEVLLPSFIFKRQRSD